MVSEFRKRRDLTLKKLREIPGIDIVAPDGAFYAFPRYDFDISSEKMAEYLLDEAHVAVTPGSSFGSFGEKHFRISFATSVENLETGLDSIKDALAKL
jgi:aspartate aminotransferase